MLPCPTYISLDVPEPMAARVVALRRVLDPDFVHLPIEIALAGSSGIGVLSQHENIQHVRKAVDTVARAHFPITTRFLRAAWLNELRVYALEVEAVSPLVGLHDSLRRSGLSFEDAVPPAFQPHCTLRWTPQWMTPEQQKTWEAILAPQGDFILRDLVLYRLRPNSGNAEPIHRASLGG